MIFLISIALNGWYFFYLDLGFFWLLGGGIVSTGVWMLYRNAYLNFDGGNENPIVALGMTIGGFGMLFSLIAMALQQLT